MHRAKNYLLERPRAGHPLVVSRRTIGAGFTLLELLVVVAMMAVLIALLLPATQAAREAARRTQCANHLRQLTLAVHGFTTAMREFPIGSQGTRHFHPTDQRQLSWIVGILPYVEALDVADRFDPKFAYDSVENRLAAGVVLPLFLCPTASTILRPGTTTGDRNHNAIWDPGDDLAFTDYGGMFGAGTPEYRFRNGMMIYDEAIRERDVTDGLSHTILIAEDVGRPLQMQSEWANGQNIFDQTGAINRTRNNEIWSDHAGGAFVVMAGGEARWCQQSMATQVLLNLCTRDQGEVIASF